MTFFCRRKLLFSPKDIDAKNNLESTKLEALQCSYVSWWKEFEIISTNSVVQLQYK